MVTDVAREAANAAGRLLRRGWAAINQIAANDVALASLVLGVLIVIFFYDVVFLSRTLLTSPFQPGALGFEPPFGYPGGPPDKNPYLLDPLASAVGAEPIVERMARLLRDFPPSLWNSNIALGRPFLAGASSANHSLIRLPLMLWPSPEMWDAFLLIRFFVAGLFTYVLAKRLGLAKPAAFGAAVAFVFSGFFMLKVNMEHVDFAMMIPVLLYAFELLQEQQRPGRMAFAVAAVATGVLAVNPQPALVLLIYGTGYYLARALALRPSNRRSPLRRQVLALGLALGLGVGLTAFSLVPLLELSGSVGFDEVGVHRHAARGLHFDQLPALISLFVPYFNGPPVDNFQGTVWTGIEGYAGVVVAFLAFMGLWNWPAMRNACFFFAGTAVILLAKTYGVPGVNWVGHLPVFGVVDFTAYLPPAIAFSLAMLAGMGLDQLSSVDRRWWLPPLAVLVLALLLGWLVWLNRGILDSISNTHLALHFSFAGVLIAATAAIALAMRRGVVASHAGMLLLVGFILFELFAFTTPTKGEFGDLARAAYGRDNVPVIERPQRYDSFIEPPYISFLKEDISKYRVVGLDGILFPNTSEAYDLDDIRGLTGITVERYLKYIRAFVDPGGRGHRFRGDAWPPLGTKDGPALLANNPMLDLLNVKYVITPPGSLLAYDYELSAQFLPDTTEEDPAMHLDVFNIDGDGEAVLFQHPPSSLANTITPTEESRFLLFRLVLDPRVWDPDKGDGVLFQVSAQEGNTTKTLLSRWVDPKNSPEDRRWIDGVVDLESYLGQPLTLVLSTSSGQTSDWDWAGWGGLRLAPSPEIGSDRSSSNDFTLVYDKEVQVYQNPDAFPRAFVVHRAVSAPGEDAAITLMQRPDFDPSTQAVVEGGPSQAQLAAMASSPMNDGSFAVITHYEDSRVEIMASMETPGLLVLSDTFYPGWKAYVDGERATIYPTNLTLRSVFLPAGEHRVEFVYSPRSFKAGLAISGASLALLAIYLAWGPTSRAAGRRLSRRDDGQ